MFSKSPASHRTRMSNVNRVHSSVNGRKFKSKMLSEHIEVLQSPWLTELGAFYINFSKSNGGRFDESLNPLFYDLSTPEPKMTLMLPDMVKLEYNLTCPICLELVFKPYALGCGHLFCKSCACAAASVIIFEGPKAACSGSKCPVCREVKYHNAIPIYSSLDIFMFLHSTRNPLVLWTRFCSCHYQEFLFHNVVWNTWTLGKDLSMQVVIQLLKEKNCTASAQLRIAFYVGLHSFSIWQRLVSSDSIANHSSAESKVIVANTRTTIQNSKCSVRAILYIMWYPCKIAGTDVFSNIWALSKFLLNLRCTGSWLMIILVSESFTRPREKFFPVLRYLYRMHCCSIIFLFLGLILESWSSIQVGVYGNAVHMIELSLLLKKQCKEYWKERAAEERAEISRQTKMYWDMQSKYMIGYWRFPMCIGRYYATWAVFHPVLGGPLVFFLRLCLFWKFINFNYNFIFYNKK